MVLSSVEAAFDAEWKEEVGIWLGTVSKLWSVDEDNIVDKEIDPAEISDCRLEEIMVWWVNCRNRAGQVLFFSYLVQGDATFTMAYC